MVGTIAPAAALNWSGPDVDQAPPGTTLEISGDLRDCYSAPGSITSYYGFPERAVLYWNPALLTDAEADAAEAQYEQTKAPAGPIAGLEELNAIDPSIGDESGWHLPFTVPDASPGEHLMVLSFEPGCGYKVRNADGTVTEDRDLVWRYVIRFCVLDDEGHCPDNEEPEVEPPSVVGDGGSDVAGDPVSSSGEDSSSTDALLIASGLIALLLGIGAGVVPRLRGAGGGSPPPIPEMPPLPAAPVIPAGPEPPPKPGENLRFLADQLWDSYRDEQRQREIRREQELIELNEASMRAEAREAAEAAAAEEAELHEQHLDKEERTNLEAQTPALIGPLQEQFASEIETMKEQGFWVANRTDQSIIWGKPMMGLRRLADNLGLTDWQSPDRRMGQCQEFARYGHDRTRRMAFQLYGDGAVVDSLWVQEESSVRVAEGGAYPSDYVDAVFEDNHTANRVVLPNGQRVMVDYWEAIGNSRRTEPRVVTEEEWLQRWESGERRVNRTDVEHRLKELIATEGEEDGFRRFREEAASKAVSATPNQAEVWIRSWKLSPW